MKKKTKIIITAATLASSAVLATAVGLGVGLTHNNLTLESQKKYQNQSVIKIEQTIEWKGLPTQTNAYKPDLRKIIKDVKEKDFNKFLTSFKNYLTDWKNAFLKVSQLKTYLSDANISKYFTLINSNINVDESINQLLNQLKSVNSKNIDEYKDKIINEDAQISSTIDNYVKFKAKYDTFLQEISKFSSYYDLSNDKFLQILLKQNGINGFNSFLTILQSNKFVFDEISNIKNSHQNVPELKQYFEQFNTLNISTKKFDDINKLTIQYQSILEQINAEIDSLKNKNKSNTQLNNLKNQAKNQITSFNLLTNDTKSQFINAIDNVLISNEINTLLSRANKLNKEKEKLNILLDKYNQLKTDNDINYINSDNKTKLDEQISKNSFDDASNSKLLKNIENIVTDNNYLEKLNTYISLISSFLNNINGNQVYQNALSEFNKIKDNNNFSDDLKKQLDEYISTQKIAADINQKTNQLSSFIDIFNKLNITYSTQLQLDKSNISQDDLNQLNSLSAAVLRFFSSDLKLKTFDLNHILNLRETLINNLALWKQKLDSLLDKKDNQNNNDYQKQAQKQLNVKLDDRLSKYDLNRYLTSLSFNLKNTKLWLQEPKSNQFNYKLTDINLKDDNKNTLILTYHASAKNNVWSGDVTSELSINNTEKDVNNIINESSIKNLDEIYNINYFNLGLYKKSDITLQILKDNLSIKQTYINNYFKFKIKENSTTFFDLNNKLNLNIELLFNNHIIKTLNVSSLNSIDFLPEDNQTFDASIFLNNAFKQSDYYKPVNLYVNPIYLGNTKYYNETGSNGQYKEYHNAFTKAGLFRWWFWKHNIEPFYEKIKSQFNNKDFFVEPTTKNNEKNFPLLDDAADHSNKLSAMQIKNIVLMWFKENNPWVNYNISSDTTVDLKTTNNHLFEIDPGDPTKSSAIFNFIVTKGQLKKEISLRFTTQNFDRINNLTQKQQKALDKIFEIFKDKSGSKLFNLIKIKNLNNTHNNYSIIQRNPEDTFNDVYILPKIGEYQIYAKSSTIESAGKHFTNNALITFSIKDGNGNEIKLNQSDYDNLTLDIKYWKPIQYRDIKPKNNNKFTDDDFKPTPSRRENNEIDQKDKDTINKINSKNFEYRKVLAEFTGHSEVKYSVLDPTDIVRQNAQIMLNYLLTFKNTTAVSVEKNEEFKDESDNFKKENVNKNEYNHDDISLSTDVSNNLNLNEINKKYFIYFYDVQNPEYGKMIFKLGFIDKTNTNKRYHINHSITLVNLKNDYKDKLYPEVILNNIKKSDLTLSSNFVAKNLSASNFNQFITINPRALTYNDYTVAKDYIKLDKLVHAGDNIYITLKYEKPGRTIFGRTWYLLGNSNNEVKVDLDISKEKPLTTVYKKNSIFRSREIELYYKDALWTFDKENNAAHWTLKSKYLAKTFESNNSNHRKIYLHLFGNVLVQNAKRKSRISDRDHQNKGGYDFEIDYDKLKTQKTITINSHTSNVFYEKVSKELPHIPFSLTTTLNDSGDINFVFELTDAKYKLVVGNLLRYLYGIGDAKFYNSDKFDEFDPNKAFLLASNAAAIHIEYENNVEENFGVKTNIFDYTKLDYNQENEPITFISDPKAYDLSWYNPNQNVDFKLHDGYLQDNEFLHRSWKENDVNIDLVNNAKSRTFGYSRGTATMLAKVNDDPNSGLFYIITNNHVEGGNKFDIDSLQGNNLPNRFEVGRYMNIALDNYSNNVDAGQNDVYTPKNIKAAIVWTGLKQLDLNGQNPAFADMTVAIVDIKPVIEQAYNSGLYVRAAWFENWYKLPPLKLNTNGQNLEFFSSVRAQFVMNGYPYAKENGYLLNRAIFSDQNVGFNRQDGYTPAYFNAGNSGTGVMGADNNYISTINSGAPLRFLQSWTYSKNFYNYFGINWDGQNPLILNNTRSLASYMMKMNAINPNMYPLPWFFKPFDN
ncbi:coiled-coil domain-containing protein [Mycoplasma sp. 4013]